MQYDELRISIFVCGQSSVVCFFRTWIHGQTTSIKQVSAVLRLYHMTITDGLCQMSLASNSVSFRQQTVLRCTHCKGRDIDTRSHEHTE